VALYAFISSDSGGLLRLNVGNGAVREVDFNSWSVAYAGGQIISTEMNPFGATENEQAVNFYNPTTLERLARVVGNTVGRRRASVAVGDDVFLKGAPLNLVNPVNVGEALPPGDLIRVSSISQSVTDTYDVRGMTARQIASGHGSVWTPRDRTDTGQVFVTGSTGYGLRVLRVDPSSGAVTAEILTGDQASNQSGLQEVVATSGYVYAARDGNVDNLHRIDPSDNSRVTYDISTQTGYSGGQLSTVRSMTAAGSDLYFINAASGLVRVDSSGTFTVLNSTVSSGGVIRHHNGLLYHAFSSESNTRRHLRIYDLDGSNVTPNGGGNITTQASYKGWRWSEGSGFPSHMAFVDLGADWGVGSINW
jgi:hypothetical protein